MSQTKRGRSNKTHSYDGSETSGDSPADLGTEATQAVKEVSRRVKEGASEALNQVKDQAGSAVESQKRIAAERIGAVGDAIRQTAQCFAGSEDDQPAFVGRLAEQAADKVDEISDYVREHDLKELVGGFENWARRNPVLFLGGSFIAGLLVARFLKSTRQPGDQENKGSSFSLKDKSDSGSQPNFRQPAYRPRDVAQHRFGRQEFSGVGSGSGSQYGTGSGSSGTPPSTSPGMSEPGIIGGAGVSGGSTSSWEEP